MFKLTILSLALILPIFADPTTTRKTLKEAINPEVTFQNTYLEEAIEYIRIRSFELTPGQGGINFNFVGPASLKTPSKQSEIVIFKKETLLKNKSLLEILDQTVAEASYAYSITDFGVELHEKDFKPTPTPKANALPAETSKKLAALKIPEMSFWNSTLQEAAAFLTIRSAEIDPGKKGFKIALSPALEKQTLTVPKLSARDVSLKATLDHLCRLRNLDYTMKDRTITLSKAIKPADPK